MINKIILDKVQEELDSAKRYAEKGNAMLMENSLTCLQEYNTNGADLSSQIEEIECLGYRNAVSSQIKKARNFSEEGNSWFMEFHLKYAIEYAQKLDADIEDECNHVRSTLLKK